MSDLSSADYSRCSRCSSDRSSDKDISQVGRFPHIHVSDLNQERQERGIRHAINSPDCGRNQLPSLEPESPATRGKGTKMSLLESRVKSVEEANCSLLKEIGKLQNELKQVGGEACGFRDQTTSWSSIMGNIEVSNNTISKIMSRLKEAEGTLYSEKLSMIMLLNRAQQLELMITDNEEEMKSQRNQSERRLTELQSVVQNIHGQKVQTERMISTLMSDVGQGKIQMELQESEIKLVREELKQVSQQMDEENKETWCNLQKQNEATLYAEESIKQLRSAFEHRMLQIENALTYFKNRQTFLESEENNLEERINTRLGDLAAAIAQQELTRQQKHNGMQTSTSENKSDQDKVAQRLEEFRKHLQQQEAQFRKEIEERFLHLEKNLHRLERVGGNFEKDLRENSGSEWSTLHQPSEDVIKTIKDQQSRLEESNVRMDSDIKQLADSFAHNMTLIEKVLKAEILDRNKQETQLEHKMEGLHERVSLALLTLQEALGILQEDFNKEKRKADSVHLENSKSEAVMSEGVTDRAWSVDSARAAMEGLLADIHRIKEDTPEEIAKMKDDLIAVRLLSFGFLKSFVVNYVSDK
ncbi:restin homolog [Leucoraja erinacea]|uniref:restin homolog n=1 Tax=Leucoraja erinaceus TaxID=7782 RepID=UPI0024577970|nr:restin homolog [Leucoraja erinacea]